MYGETRKQEILRLLGKEAWYTGFDNQPAEPPFLIKRRGRPRKRHTTIDEERKAYLDAYNQGRASLVSGVIDRGMNPFTPDNIRKDRVRKMLMPHSLDDD
jgi:hypothetical protein